MTFYRDLAWKNLDLLNRSSIAHQYARYALGLNYDVLPEEVVHQAKRCVLDALACAVGALDAPGRSICESLSQELGGPEEATLFGSGLRTSALNATLANGFLVRFLDYNDLGGGDHNSDAISGILAVAERGKNCGKDFVTALVISYELGERIIESVPGRDYWLWEKNGWTCDIRGGVSMSPAFGKLMGLTEDQIANAIGICASRSLPLGILDANREECTMSKNTRFAFVSYDAIVSCLLAKKGFTGPVRVVEGESGLRQVLLKGQLDLESLCDFSGWRILSTRHKSLPLNGTTHGHVFATLAIIKEQDLRPVDIAEVKITAGQRECMHTTTPAKKYPRNAESADHSAFWANAIAIKDRSFVPQTFTDDNFTDPVVLDLIEKITVAPDPSMPPTGIQGACEIVTTDGRRFYKRIDTPHGLGNDPLSDEELEQKFTELATSYMGKGHIQQIFDTVWNLEKLEDMGTLAALMVIPPEYRS